MYSAFAYYMQCLTRYFEENVPEFYFLNKESTKLKMQSKCSRNFVSITQLLLQNLSTLISLLTGKVVKQETALAVCLYIISVSG